MTGPAAKVAATALAALLVAAGCTGGSGGTAAAGPDPSERPRAVTTTTRPTTTTSTTTTSTTTTLPPFTAPPAPPPGLGRGSSGPEVLALEQRLDALRYDVGKIDGVFDANTGHAVMAFQKVHDLPRTSRATQDVLDRLGAPTVPAELVPGGGATKVEIDLRRQILLLFVDGQLFRILAVSTGSGKRYCVDGECARAVTPGGSYRVLRRISGWRRSRLGLLYNPLYFNGGIAIHGAPSVPGYPASHGCVRIPMFSSGWFPKVVPNGTPVYVVGGPRAPVPFNEPMPGEEPPTSTTTTSTTAPGGILPRPESTTTSSAPSTSSTTVTSTTTTTVAGGLLPGPASSTTSSEPGQG